MMEAMRSKIIYSVNCKVSDCNFTGNSREESNDHYKTVHLVKYFKCKCNKKEYTSSELKKHFQTCLKPLNKSYPLNCGAADFKFKDVKTTSFEHLD